LIYARETVLFCCGMHPLHPQICLLFPSADTILGLILPISSMRSDRRSPSAKASIARSSETFFVEFLLRSSVVCMSAVSCRFFAC
jgi:hypothetical protein